jgi:hypothetical protein
MRDTELNRTWHEMRTTMKRATSSAVFEATLSLCARKHASNLVNLCLVQADVSPCDI